MNLDSASGSRVLRRRESIFMTPLAPDLQRPGFPLDGFHARLRDLRRLAEGRLMLNRRVRPSRDTHHAASNDRSAVESGHSMEMRYCAPASCPCPELPHTNGFALLISSSVTLMLLI